MIARVDGVKGAPKHSERAALALVCQYAPTGLASRFDNGNPHGFSGFVEAKFEQIGTGEGHRQPLLFAQGGLK